MPVRRCNFLLAFPGHRDIPLSLDLPDDPVTFRDILPQIRQAADALFGRTAELVAEMGRPVACGPGCGVCCNQLVVVNEFEALDLARVVDTMEQSRRDAVRANFASALVRLEESGLLPRLLAAFTGRVADGPEMRNLQREYFKLAVPCPFLLEGSCGIHPVRPLLCRQYSVSSDPAHCAAVYEEGTPIIKLLHPVDVAGAAAAFDGDVPRPTAGLPLTLIFLLRHRLLRTVRPKIPGHVMAARFLDYMANYYRA